MFDAGRNLHTFQYLLSLLVWISFGASFYFRFQFSDGFLELAVDHDENGWVDSCVEVDGQSSHYEQNVHGHVNLCLFHLHKVPEEVGEIRNRPETDPGHRRSEETHRQQVVPLLFRRLFSSVLLVLLSVVFKHLDKTVNVCSVF